MKPPADPSRRRTLSALLVGAAWVVFLGGWLIRDRTRAAASADVARAFMRGLYSGDPARSYELTSRRFRSLNDAASFAAQYGAARHDAVIDLGRHTFGDDRVTFDGHVQVGGGLRTALRIVLVEEAGAWKVDTFALGL